MDWNSKSRNFRMSFFKRSVSFQCIAFYPVDVTIKDGIRWSTYEAFLKPALVRSNLNVVRYAAVKKVRAFQER